MIFSTSEIIHELSKLFELKAGDLIFTGTPAGVGAVGPGDRLDGRIAGLTPLAIEIVAATD
jgi:fumarylpyruvate hydrolase